MDGVALMVSFDVDVDIASLALVCAGVGGRSWGRRTVLFEGSSYLYRLLGPDNPPDSGLVDCCCLDGSLLILRLSGSLTRAVTE